ncbi:MAG: DUF5060 domain-containing protein [Fimbriimonas sp.]|nr:DUF5060 domain-containing protein [Fimbriimonas sp.]
MLSLLGLSLAVRAQNDPIVTPYFVKEPLAIRSIKGVEGEVAQFGVEELTIGLDATYDNPFDPGDISLDANVTTPKGETYTIPGFFYRSYSRAQSQGKESLTPSGTPEWRVRLCPTEPGAYTVVLTAKDRTGAKTSNPFQFRVQPSKAHGRIRVSPRNRQYFEFDDGTAFYPIGANVCWGNDPGTFSYDEWLPEYSKAGANYFRVWLGPAWVTFAMEVGGKPEEGKGFGQFCLPNAWRLDHVMDEARQGGLNVMLSIDSYNTLRAHSAYPAWDKAPQNRDNGGPIRIWTDFWTNSQIEKWYKAKLRYLVARYAAYSNLMSWEFWNEVDLTEDYSAEVVKAWHRRMGGELRRLDPYHHMLTTSLSDSMGNRDIDLLPELDYDQTHTYDNPDVAGSVLYQQSRKSEWGKPHYVGEIGASSSNTEADKDPDGMQIHDPIWMSLATASSGTAMAWWWDSLIAPHHLYPLYAAASKFVAGIDWPSEDFRRTTPIIHYRVPPKNPERKDLDFQNGPVQWTEGDANKPHFISVRDGKADGDLPLPGIQHGVRNHRDWHNPVRFKVSLDRETRFEVMVGDVSGYGGATLQVSLDGDPVMTREFPAGDGAVNGQSVGKYAGHYGITVPKGDHTIVVENIGNDWFMVSYRFVDLLKRTGPAIQGWAVEGNTTAIVWLRPDGRTWHRAIIDKAVFPPTPECKVSLDGLASGDWAVEIWDTWKGIILSTETSHVSLAGTATVSVPSFAKDLAIKLTKVDKHRREG